MIKLIETFNATAIILAGGKSSRYGTDKSFLEVNGKSLIKTTTEILNPLFNEIIISSNKPEKFYFSNIKIVQDLKKDCGPLMGIYSCLQKTSNDINFIIATDIPKINLKVIDKLMSFSHDYEIVVPVNNGQYEPLFAIYNTSILKTIESLISKDKRKISNLFSLCKTKFLNLENGEWLININTKNDYLNFISKSSNKELVNEH
ncbi:MAG: molybdenum cofactor guanylyltransferase [Pseudomonadota bacterium]